VLPHQWLIVHEFLSLFVGSAVADDVMNSGRRFYTPHPGETFIPVESQIAYGFGHSMVRPSYRANFTGNDGAPSFAMFFDGTPPGPIEPDDLRGDTSAASDGSSDGRRSSASPDSRATCGRPSASIPRCRRRCSICR
jgi:hypothetical protein